MSIEEEMAELRKDQDMIREAVLRTQLTLVDMLDTLNIMTKSNRLMQKMLNQNMIVNRN